MRAIIPVDFKGFKRKARAPGPKSQEYSRLKSYLRLPKKASTMVLML